jgi:asparagine N-glycosylation enzyme membrane subunit Stt3
VPIILSIVSRLIAGRAFKPTYYLLTLLGLAGITLIALRVIDPGLFKYIVDQFNIFNPGGASLTILEVQPLTAQIAWGNFTTSFFISFISFAMLIYLLIKEKSADITLFLVWSMIMLMAALGQRFKKREKKARQKAKSKTFMQPRGVWVRVIVIGVVIFFAVFFPNIPQARTLGSQQNYIMNEGWYSSCLWLKDNSPEPFGDPDFYYELYPPRSEFKYPETAYGVMSWWDYGYFIMQIAHRIPNANPTQSGATRAGQFFTAQNESSANDFADKFGSKYVMIDNAMVTGKFYAMVDWAEEETGKSVDDFYEIYYAQQQDGGGQWVPLYYPAYYKSTVARLYNFDGEAVVPTESAVISYSEQESTEGINYKVVTSYQSFTTYEEAEAYVASQTSGNYRIVGTTAFSSPVPLEELNSYELVHSSGDTTSSTTVKIFKYLGSDES